MACPSGPLLADQLLGAVCNLAAVLGLVGTLPLVCKILLYIKPNGVIVRLDSENLLIENYSLILQNYI